MATFQRKFSVGDEVITPDGRLGVVVDVQPETLYPYWISSLECTFIGIYTHCELQKAKPGSEAGVN